MTVRVGTYQTRVLQLDQASGSVQLTASSGQSGTFALTFGTVTASRPLITQQSSTLPTSVLYSDANGQLIGSSSFTFAGGSLTVGAVVINGTAISGATTISCSSTITSSAGGLVIAGPISGTTGVTALNFANFASVAAPSTDGAVWYDSTRVAHVQRAVGLNVAMGGTLYATTSSGTGITSATGKQNMLEYNSMTSVGTLTLPASFLVAGRALRIDVGGTFQSSSDASPSLNLQLTLGSSTNYVVNNGAKTVTNNITGAVFHCVCILIARAAPSASSAVYGNICFMFNNGTATMYMIGGNNTGNFSTDGTLALGLYATCVGATTRSTTVTVQNVMVTVIS